MDTKKKRFSKGKAAVLLSVCTATVLCANLVGACSADDDDIYYGDELKTRAKATRGVSGDAMANPDKSVTAGSHIVNKESIKGDFCVDFYISWTTGWIRGCNTPQSSPHASASPYHEGEQVNTVEEYSGDRKYKSVEYDKCYVNSASGKWIVGDQIQVTFKYQYDTYKETYRLRDNQRVYNHVTHHYNVTYTKGYSYGELGCKEDSALIKQWIKDHEL